MGSQTVGLGRASKHSITLVALLRIDFLRREAGQKHVINYEFLKIIPVIYDGGLHLGSLWTGREKWQNSLSILRVESTRT